MENNKLTVDLNGSDITLDVFDIIDNMDNQKSYIVYGIEGNDIDVYISELEETENSYSLKNIEDLNELKMVEDYLRENTQPMQPQRN